MKPVHYYVGDVGPVTTGASSFVTCNCACSRCIAGDCCLVAPYTGMWPSTVTTASLTVMSECGAANHDFDRLAKSRLYCRKCGTTRKV